MILYMLNARPGIAHSINVIYLLVHLCVDSDRGIPKVGVTDSDGFVRYEYISF